MDLGIKGRVAVVCGSSQGLGRAVAETLAEEGARVVVNSRSPEKLAATGHRRRDGRRSGGG